MQWYRRDPAFLWVRVARRSEDGALAYRVLSEEIEHWLAVPRSEFDEAIARQLADRDAPANGSLKKQGASKADTVSSAPPAYTALGATRSYSTHAVS